MLAKNRDGPNRYSSAAFSSISPVTWPPVHRLHNRWPSLSSKALSFSSFTLALFSFQRLHLLPVPCTHLDSDRQWWIEAFSLDLVIDSQITASSASINQVLSDSLLCVVLIVVGTEVKACVGPKWTGSFDFKHHSSLSFESVHKSRFEVIKICSSNRRP